MVYTKLFQYTDSRIIFLSLNVLFLQGEVYSGSGSLIKPQSVDVVGLIWEVGFVFI